MRRQRRRDAGVRGAANTPAAPFVADRVEGDPAAR